MVDVRHFTRRTRLAAEFMISRSAGLGLTPNTIASSSLHNAPRHPMSRERVSLDIATHRSRRRVTCAKSWDRNAPAASFIVKGSLKVRRRSPDGRRARPEFAIFKVSVGTADRPRLVFKPIHPTRSADAAPPTVATRAAPAPRRRKPLAFCRRFRGPSIRSQL